MRQYGADVTLIEKFKHYDNVVTNPDEADIFLVPYPHSSHCRIPSVGAGWNHCGGLDAKFTRDLVKSLPYFNKRTKYRHLFLLTGDLGNNHQFLEDMPLYVTLGGVPNVYHDHALPANVTPIVIPPPITEPDYQPSVMATRNWTAPRKYSVTMNAGLVTWERVQADKILKSVHSVGGLPTLYNVIKDHRKFSLPPGKVWENYRNTVFCPVLKGDLPYQKRFYDVIVSGCIPVVWLQKSSGQKETGCYSWWGHGAPNYAMTHAFARGGRTRQ